MRCFNANQYFRHGVSLMVSVSGFGPLISCAQGTRFSLTKLHAVELALAPGVEPGTARLGRGLPSCGTRAKWSAQVDSNHRSRGPEPRALA